MIEELKKVTEKLRAIKTAKIGILFGSQAKGCQKKESDIDICVITDGNDDRPLEFSSPKYDISLFHKLPLTFRYRALREGSILFSKDGPLLAKVKFWTIKQYLDEKYFRDRFVEKVLG
jgi:predicted nucleotidyltransferase